MTKIELNGKRRDSNGTSPGWVSISQTHPKSLKGARRRRSKEENTEQDGMRWLEAGDINNFSFLHLFLFFFIINQFSVSKKDVCHE